MSKKKAVAEELFCICRRPFDDNDEDQMMIECDECNDWLHGKCVGVSIREAADIEIYICPRCVTEDKKIIYKKCLNNHRHDFSDPDGFKKPMQAGTKAFVEKLLTRSFPDAIENKVVKRLSSGSDLTIDYFEKHGFDCPILIENKKELQFSMPDSCDINLTKIENIVGSDYEIDVIDVERQESFPMKIAELNEYFMTWPRKKTYNLISFEISKTNLTLDITAPKIVCDISWASNNIWPQSNDSTEVNSDGNKNNKATKNYLVKPEVQKYCLISAANSYTDFHVDFGGSSVWYHTVKGDKVFYLMKPTDENLKTYEKWLCFKNHSEVFLGDKIKDCYIFRVKEGNTIFLPTGWIHAVYTPHDSLVFGGNFLHSYNIPLQLKIYDMEMRLKTPEKFRFPAFETFQWYALKHFEQKLKKANANRECIKRKELNDLKHLRDQLKKWISSKNFYELHDYQVPRTIDCEKLVNMMNRELYKAEVLLKSDAPTENSLKIKLKLNPTNLSSSTSTLVCDEKPKAKKEKEVLAFAPNLNIPEIKIDHAEIQKVKEDKDPLEDDKLRPPIRLVMKIPKLYNACADSLLTNPAIVETQSEPIKPIKLKIKTQDMVTIASNVKDDIEYESDAEMHNEDDELMNELKNSYQDNDFFYPSLKSCGTTARTSKKVKKEEMKLEPFVTNVNQSEVNDTGEKQSRKRKIKPHAAQYLETKPESTNDSAIENGKQEIKETEVESPKNRLEKMIEKNLTKEKPEIDTGNSQDDSKAGESDDIDFNVEDEDDLDYDQEFKIKCEQNLKLSKKLKTKSVKHQKKLDSQDTDGAGTTRTTDPTSKSSNQLNKKSKKKGYATTKQRLGKLLKLNRLVNI